MMFVFFWLVEGKDKFGGSCAVLCTVHTANWWRTWWSECNWV